MNVYWDGPIKGMTEEGDTRLNLKKMTLKHEGVYKCIGMNSAGQTSLSITVKMESRLIPLLKLYNP